MRARSALSPPRGIYLLAGYGSPRGTKMVGPSCMWTYACAQPIPFYEACLLLGGHGLEDTFWEHTLTAVAEFFEQEGLVIKRRRLLDRHRNWGRAWLIWYNAALRSMLWEAIAPVRSLWTKMRLAAQRDA